MCKTFVHIYIQRTMWGPVGLVLELLYYIYTLVQQKPQDDPTTFSCHFNLFANLAPPTKIWTNASWRYTNHTSNSEILRKVAEHIGKFDTLLEIVKKRKLIWFGQVVRAKGTLAYAFLQGKVEEKRSRGRPGRQWLDDVKEWICWVWMRCGGSKRAVRPGASGSVVLPQWTQYSMGFKIQTYNVISCAW